MSGLPPGFFRDPLVLPEPWVGVPSTDPLAYWTVYKRDGVTVVIEEPTTIPDFDWHISVSMDGQKPSDRICELVLAQAGAEHPHEQLSALMPNVRHFFGYRRVI